MSYTFIYKRPEEHAPYSAVKSVTMEVEDERSLPEMQQAFTEFLRSAGFVISIDEDYVGGWDELSDSE